MSEKLFSRYLHWKTASTVGDEIWKLAIPLYFGTKNLSSRELGYFISTLAVAEVLSYFFAPRILSQRISLCLQASRIDFTQVVLFALIGAVLLFTKSSDSLWVLLVLASTSRFLSGVWFVASETLLPRLRDLGSADEVQRKNFVAWTVGASAGPSLGTYFFASYGIFSACLLNCFSFLGQAFLLRRLSALEPAVEKELQAPPQFWSGLSAGVGNAYLLWTTVFATLCRVFCMGFVPFVLFYHANSGTFTVACLATSYPLATYLGARFWTPNAPWPLNFSYFAVSLFFLASGLALILAHFSNASPWVLVFVLFGFGAALGNFTVQARSLRQTLVAPQLLGAVISSQVFWGRLTTPLSGLLFGSTFLNSENKSQAFLCLLVLTLAGVFSLAKMQNAIRRLQSKKELY
jgi:hypothetical protein